MAHPWKKLFISCAALVTLGFHSTSLTQVTGVELVSSTSQSIRLHWTNQSTADSFQIRVLKPNGHLLKKITTTHHSKAIKGLQPDTAYTFKIRARTGSDHGTYSDPLTIRTKVDYTLFGFWGLNGFISTEGLTDVEDRFSTTVFQVASSSPTYTVNTLLPLVQASDMKVTLRLSGDHSNYTTNGNFDLAKWKDQLRPWENSGVQAFINDGTVAGHMLLDDIDTFEGADPTANELDKMAKFSQKIFPGLMTFVRQQATDMPTPTNNSQQYQYVDAVDNQYKSNQGSVTDYAVRQAAAAESLGVHIINGLNIADGGDGSSGQPGSRAGKFAMSAEEISSYGQALLGMSGVKMLLLWEYDSEQTWSDGSIGSDYFDQAELQRALADLGAKAAATL